MSASLLAAQLMSGALAAPEPAVTPVGTAGSTASMATMASSDSEPTAPGTGMVIAATLPEPSLMLPPASERDAVPVVSSAGVRSPVLTVYENARLAVPDPLMYGSVTVRVPTFSASVGVPVTNTGSVNDTYTGMTVPARYVPGPIPAATPATDGAEVSTMYEKAIDPLPVPAGSPCTCVTFTPPGVTYDDPPPLPK